MSGGGRPVFRPLKSCLPFFRATPLFADQASAQRSGAPLPNKPQLGTLGERINANTIAIISGNPNATYMSIAYDMSAVLDDGDEVRILPVIGKGGGQNIKDVRFLKGVDLGITQSNLLGYYKRTNEIGTIDDKIVYIAKLFNEEMHLIVREGSGINSLARPRWQEGELLRHRLRHATVDTRHLRAARHQAGGSEHGAGRCLRSAEARRDRRHDPDRRQAGGLDGQAESAGWVPHPSRRFRQAAAGRLPAGDAFDRGLSGSDRAGAEGRDDRGQRGADRVQLAEGHRPLSAHPEVRRHVLSRGSPNSRRRRAIRNGRKPTSRR